MNVRFTTDMGTRNSRYIEGTDAVYPRALLFRAGSYPDKNFSLTPEELKAAADLWMPLAGNIEHSDFLRGRAAFVRTAWTEDNDNLLIGEVRIPLALDVLLSDDERKISLEWDRFTKRPKAVALTTRPRISDAVLMSLDRMIPTTLTPIDDVYARRGSQKAACLNPTGPIFDRMNQASGASFSGSTGSQQGTVNMSTARAGAPDLAPVEEVYANRRQGELAPIEEVYAKMNRR